MIFWRKFRRACHLEVVVEHYVRVLVQSLHVPDPALVTPRHQCLHANTMPASSGARNTMFVRSLVTARCTQVVCARWISNLADEEDNANKLATLFPEGRPQANGKQINETENHGRFEPGAGLKSLSMI